MDSFLHNLLHNHATPVAPEVGRIHLCKNRITGREKNYFKAEGDDVWYEIPKDLTLRLMRSHSVKHAHAILNMWRNSDGTYGDFDLTE